MTASLVSHNLTVRRGPLTVLESVDLTLSPGDRLGVIGPNGIGKSTLLRALSGQVELEAGHVEIAPRTSAVGYLPQETERTSETVDEFLSRRTGVNDAQQTLDRTTHALAADVAGAADDYSDALERWLSLGAADFDSRVGETWVELGLHQRLRGQAMLSLSGGEAARVALASLLLSRFDVLLLDEPTNDLDLDGLHRLERWVLNSDAPLLVVSHDRAFLDRTVTGVLEIDHHSHRVERFNGGWAAFLAERELARQRAQNRFNEYSSKRQTLLDRGQREREWSAKGQGRARRSSENDKHVRNFQMDQTEQLAGRAARTDRAIERLDRNDSVDEPRTPWELHLDIPTVGRSGDSVAWLQRAVVERPDFTFGPADFALAWGDRVAIVGPNGAGKSTLIELLLGRITPTSGAASTGSSVVVGEIEQARLAFAGDDDLLAGFIGSTGYVVADARRLLAKFRLGPEQLGRPGSTLSPGERTRASLAVLMANGANLLVLDEPTNHLDLEAIEQLELALDAFAGTLLLVTHDRALLDAVRFTRTVEVVDGVVLER